MSVVVTHVPVDAHAYSPSCHSNLSQLPMAPSGHATLGLAHGAPHDTRDACEAHTLREKAEMLK
jgi:hypothetical protein